MMSLAKTDKIIAIVAVIILVAAAISIIVYTQTYEEPEKVTVEPKEKTFDVTWSKDTGEMSSIHGEAKKTYEDTINVNIPSSKICVLTNVEITINWEDDHTYGILTKKGLDTLTGEITPSNGDTVSDSSKGSGNMTYSFSIYSKPSSSTITAKDEAEAISKIKDQYSGKDSASFDVAITVKTGERIFRFLKYLKDKGNDFDIEVTYTYYYAELNEEEKSSGDDNGSTNYNPSEYEYNGFLGSYWNDIFKGSCWA